LEEAVSNNKSSLEERVAAALTAEKLTSAALGALIAEVEQAAVDAGQAAKDTRERALDPIIAGASALRQQADDLCFESDRLNAALPRLQQRYRQATGQECYDAWAADFDAVVPRHAVAVERLRSVYTEFEQQLVAALSEAQAVDAEARRLMHYKPYHLTQASNDRRYLGDVELAAREISALGLGTHSIVRDLKLPAFANAHRLAWPPPPPDYTAGTALSIPVRGPEYSAQRRAESERALEYYATQQRLKEEREAREERQRIAARR
jgi:hypothetical protein